MVLGMMNEFGCSLEVDALSADGHPFGFHAASVLPSAGQSHGAAEEFLTLGSAAEVGGGTGVGTGVETGTGRESFAGGVGGREVSEGVARERERVGSGGRGSGGPRERLSGECGSMRCETGGGPADGRTAGIELAGTGGSVEIDAADETAILAQLRPQSLQLGVFLVQLRLQLRYRFVPLAQLFQPLRQSDLERTQRPHLLT